MDLVPIILSALLIVSTISGLLAKRLLWSLILLFYSSLLLGGIMIWYGAIYAGLFQIITFAGAVSVMFMVILMLVGQDPPEKFRLTTRSITGVLLSAVTAILFGLFADRFATVPQLGQGVSSLSASVSELDFLWNFQSWNLLFVLLPLGSAVLVVVNLFSGEGDTE